MRKAIIDEFTDLKIWRQRKYQLRQSSSKPARTVFARARPARKLQDSAQKVLKTGHQLPGMPIFSRWHGICRHLLDAA